MRHDCLRFAVLVDGDQHLRNLAAIHAIVTELGQVETARIYSNWESDDRRVWKKYAERVGFVPVSLKHDGVNATDHTLIVDAMTILYEQDPDGFCVASNDRGFIPLIDRLNQRRKRCVIVGAEQYRDTYPAYLGHDFRALDDPRLPTLPAAMAHEAERILAEAMNASPKRPRGVLLTELVQSLRRTAPDFDTREFGFSGPGDLVAALTSLEVDPAPAGGEVYVRFRSRPPPERFF